jgi:putative dimethyl sulfoxide reductase chaperone
LETHPHTMNNQDWLSFFTAEMLTCGLLGRLLIAPPQEDWLRSIAQENVFSEIPLGTDLQETIQGSELMQDWARTYVQDHSGEIHQTLQDDFTRLFVGPGKVLAAPWESVYKTKERLVFQEQTLDVRKWYRRFGLESETIYKEPDDHIGLELLFIAHMAEKGLAAVQAKDNQSLNDILRAQWQFLQEHPLSWINPWSADVGEFSRTDYYRGIALLVKGTLREIKSTFEKYFGVQ